MTHAEYLKAVREALANLDKSNKEDVHRFNCWRNELYSSIHTEGTAAKRAEPK